MSRERRTTRTPSSLKSTADGSSALPRSRWTIPTPRSWSSAVRWTSCACRAWSSSRTSRGRALADPVYRPFFEEADRRKVCVFVHPMIPAAADAFTGYVLGPIVGFPFDTTVAIAKLCYAGVFKQLPNIRWLVAHAGGAIPYLLERLDSGWRDFAECRVNIDQPPSLYLKRLYYDTVTFSPHNLRLLRDVVGADHMVMGSDYPHLLGSIEKAVTSIEGMDSSRAEKERVVSGTALSHLNSSAQTARR